MKQIAEGLMAVGFVLSGTDTIFLPVYQALNPPIIKTSQYTANQPAYEFLQFLLIAAGLGLLAHTVYSWWKENQAN